MANIINQLEISGITYDIQDASAQAALSGKQDTLVSGTNIKTINNESLLGSGNIDIQGGTGDAYTKAETDALLAAKADTSTVTSAVTEFSAALGGEIQRAQEAEQVISGAVDAKANSSDVYLKSSTSSSTEINNALQAKADASTTYSKTEVDNAINAATSGKADTSTVTSAVSEFTTALSNEILRAQGVEQELSGAIDGKQATLISGTNIKTINNESLLGSGNITIQGGGANVVELTQAEYDALVVKDPDTFYIISDATEIDANNFYLKTQTSSSTQIAAALQAKADASTTSSATQISDALAGKQNTLTAGTGISITNDVISVTGGGGGGSYTAGRGISISNDQISLDVPVYKADWIGSSAVIGLDNIASVQGASDCLVGGYYCGIENADMDAGYGCVAMGMQVGTKNGAEAAVGKHNLPTSASTTFGDSGNTLFTVGNGNAFNARHNAFEVRANGDIYFPDTNNTTYQNYYEKPMLKLQDVLDDKQNVLTAGTGIDITNNVISVTGGGGGGGTIDASLDANSPNAVANSAITAGINNAVTSATAEFTNVYSALGRKQPMLTAGTGIDITDNVISVTGGGGGGGKAVSAGTNISITTGDTADTINCTLPITISNSDNGTKQSIAIGDGSSAHISNWYDSIAIGKNSKGYFGSVVIGGNPTAYTQNNGSNVAIGDRTKFYDNSVVIGAYAEGYNGWHANSVAIGASATASNIAGAVAIGYNVRTSGTTKTNINNQIKVDTNNQVYIKDSSNTNEICIQNVLDGKQNTLTAGTGIDITDNVISVTGGGGGGTIDAALDASSPNAVANSAITAGINNAVTSATAEFTNVYSALSRKQPMLTAGTGIDITDNVISVTGGGGGTIDAALDASSPNAVANSAITAGIDARVMDVSYYFVNTESGVRILGKSYRSGTSIGIGFLSSINNKPIINDSFQTVNKFSLVETSAITTTLDSSSTDSQVPSAKAVYDIVGNINALLSAI